MSLINIKEFTLAKNQIKGTGALYSHTVNKGTLKNHPSKWFCKEIESPHLAHTEILAQEFLRLIIPHQPETRIAKNFETGTYYILSEKVAGFRNLPRDQKDGFRNNHFTGLGQAMFCSIFLQEIDLKNGNIGIDKFNRIIKIDGDWCFSQDRISGDYRMTPQAIEALPRTEDYPCHNWLDLTVEGSKRNHSNIVDDHLSNSPQYRAEVNQAIYKICLLPDSFIEAFVDTYKTAGGQPFVDLIKARRDALQISALQNSSFNTYLNSQDAIKDAKDILLQMKEFKHGNRFILSPEKHKVLEGEFHKGLDFQKMICRPIIVECERLLNKIDAHRMTPHDKYMDAALAQYANKIKIHESNLQKLTEIKDRLSLTLSHVAGAKDILKKISAFKLGPQDQVMDDTLNTLHIEISKNLVDHEKISSMKPMITSLYSSVSSQEIAAVQQAATKFRNSSGFFGKSKKANNIESALLNTPLEDRGKVISSSDANLVQEALAKHRQRGKVYKTKDGKIDHKNAPKSFRQIKQQFPGDINVSFHRESRMQIMDERPQWILL